MTITWALQTNGDPLATSRRLLGLLWERAGLEGMILPVYQAGLSWAVPGWIASPTQLELADPFIPLTPLNSSRLVVQMVGERPDVRAAAVLRSCEARALYVVARRERLELANWLIIGVDCLASFGADEYAWRVQRAAAAERLTREALRFARQGGIAAYRFRPACQMCISPLAPPADLTLEVLGLPVNRVMLVSAKDQALAARLGLEDLVDGPAEGALLVQRRRLSIRLSDRRLRRREALLEALPANLPLTPRDLYEHIAACAPCQKCLEVCPVYDGELEARLSGKPFSADEAQIWLVSCVKCGMCEQACPRSLPLTAIHARLSRELI